MWHDTYPLPLWKGKCHYTLGTLLNFVTFSRPGYMITHRVSNLQLYSHVRVCFQKSVIFDTIAAPYTIKIEIYNKIQPLYTNTHRVNGFKAKTSALNYCRAE